MTYLDPSMSAFAVAPADLDGDDVAMTQRLTAALADHRGRIDMPALAVLADSIIGTPFWNSFGRSFGTVQSWLALTAGAPMTIGERVLATSALAHRDDDYGITTMSVANDDSHVVCTGIGRSVRVGRASDASAITDDGSADLVLPWGSSPDSSLPPPIDPGLDGRQILSAITGGRLPTGPLCQLLSAGVTSSDDELRLTAEPQPWMANPLGAMHGGVVAALLAQACSFAGQLHTGPGQSYVLADLSVNFFRSPPVDDGPLTVLTAPDRIGRRLGTVSATMVGSGGRLLARAVANIRYG